MMAQLRIDVWSDLACPWCYIGKRRLEKALAGFVGRDNVNIVWRSFELNPSAVQESDEGKYSERLAKKYGTSVREAEQMISRVKDVARAEGLNFEFELIQHGSTFDAHRLLHLALEHGIQDAVKERLLRAYFCEGQAIWDVATLIRLGADAGLQAEQIERVLTGDTYAQQVRQDEAEAREMGISGVPFFVLAERYAVSGAQPHEVLTQAFERAYRDIEQPSLEYSEGAACEPDGC